MTKYFFLILSLLFFGCTGNAQKETGSGTIPHKSETKTDTLSTQKENSSQVNQSADKNENNGVEIKVDKTEYSISETSPIRYTIINHTDSNVLTGYAFELEYWSYSKWENVPLRGGFVDLGIGIEKGSSHSFSFKLSDAKEFPLKEGKYRIRQSVSFTHFSIMEKRLILGEEIDLLGEFLLME